MKNDVKKYINSLLLKFCHAHAPFYTINFQLSIIMNGVKKQNLPSKICVVCNRPFTWRKKWEKVWEQVKYCSQKCKTSL